MNVAEMRAQLDTLQREVQRAEDKEQDTEREVAEAKAVLIGLGLNPDADLDAQVGSYGTVSERATTRAIKMYERLKEQVGA